MDARLAFNLGLGCGESDRFGMEILAKNGISHRSAIAEAARLIDSASGLCGAATARHDVAQAYIAVFSDWAKLYSDWLLDSVLPRVVIAEDGIHVRRYLYGLVIEREWETGDVSFAWHPVRGLFYPNDLSADVLVATAARAHGIDWRLRDGQVSVARSVLREADALGIQLSATAVPWVEPRVGLGASYQRQFVIEPKPSPETRCFVAIPADGLSSWDGGNHLTARSRLLVTDRLAAKLQGGICAVHGGPF